MVFGRSNKSTREDSLHTLCNIFHLFFIGPQIINFGSDEESNQSKRTATAKGIRRLVVMMPSLDPHRQVGMGAIQLCGVVECCPWYFCKLRTIRRGSSRFRVFMSSRYDLIC